MMCWKRSPIKKHQEVMNYLYLNNKKKQIDGKKLERRDQGQQEKRINTRKEVQITQQQQHIKC